MIKIIILAALIVGVDPQLMIGVCETENHFRNIAGDNGKSIGICQVQCGTAQWMTDVEWGKGKVKFQCSNLWNPLTNAIYAAKFIKFQTHRYRNAKNKDYCVLSAYNAGSCIKGNAWHVKKVLKNKRKYKHWRGLK